MRRADDDVPTTWDFRIPWIAATWAHDSELKKPQRPEVRARIAERVAAGRIGERGANPGPGAPRILELGCGPGYLAEAILDECTSYGTSDARRHCTRSYTSCSHPAAC
jgi:hypothetical protein